MKQRIPTLNNYIKESLGDPTVEDYMFLIDQLSNSMELYNSKYEFVNHMTKETNFDDKELFNIWHEYWNLDSKTRMNNDTSEWQEWIDKIIEK